MGPVEGKYQSFMVCLMEIALSKLTLNTSLSRCSTESELSLFINMIEPKTWSLDVCINHLLFKLWKQNSGKKYININCYHYKLQIIVISK